MTLSHAITAPSARVTHLFGPPRLATLPAAEPTGDNSQAFEQALRSVQGATVVLFGPIEASRLDDFFRLRLAQRLRRQGCLPALSVVMLSPQPGSPRLAGGFADRFRSSWPFARCVFATDGFDPPPELVAALGLPVTRLDDSAAEPVVSRSIAGANQRIAMQIQPMLLSSGSTMAFENQAEDLVRAGFLTIRVFTDPSAWRGATLASRLRRLIPENTAHAGPQINVAAVPPGPPERNRAQEADGGWAHYLRRQASCVIVDRAVREAVGQAECAIVNYMETVGLGLALAPRARLLLDVHDDREVGVRLVARAQGASEAQTDVMAGHAARVQQGILSLVDVCTHVSHTEAARLGPFSERSTVVLPRAYPQAVVPPDRMAFDLFLVGDGHLFNVVSLRWFLDQVWRPWLAPAGLSVAVVGRVGQAIDQSAYADANLVFAGYVDDIETFRAGCRLTVVPDQGGTGIAVKMLTTLAAGHPMATTPLGLRGLDPLVVGLIPAFDDPRALAADILALLQDPGRLAERQAIVQRMQRALRFGPGYADCFAGIPAPTRRQREQRADLWARLVAPAPRPDREPYHFVIGTPFALSGGACDDQVLMDGWHEAEPWGRWTDGADAAVRIALAEPAAGPLALEIDVQPSAATSELAFAIDGLWLPPIDAVNGPNRLDLPPRLIAGKTSFVVSLHAGGTICPADQGSGSDDRILGIGVRALRLVANTPTLLALGQALRLSQQPLPWDLLQDGWHAPEAWGCWTNGLSATLRLTLAEPPANRIGLELDLVPSSPDAGLTVAVNDQDLPGVTPVDGINRWELPAAISDGQTGFRVRLSVSGTVRPADADPTLDSRVLGIGVRGVRLHDLGPVAATPGAMLPLTRTADTARLLGSGWHRPEDWGCWTSGADAALRLAYAEPLRGRLALAMDITPSRIGAALTVTVNGQALAAVAPAPGRNTWTLPHGCYDGRRELVVGLHVSATYCPAATGGSTDDRVLGIGVQAVGLVPAATGPCPIGETVRISNAADGLDPLRAGWHKREPWGCWSAGNEAWLELDFDAPLEGKLALSLNLAPPPFIQPVTGMVNDVELHRGAVSDGINRWDLPAGCVQGRGSLTVCLLVEFLVRPMDIQDSKDDRLLGVGIRSVAVAPA